MYRPSLHVIAPFVTRPKRDRQKEQKYETKKNSPDGALEIFISSLIHRALSAFIFLLFQESPTETGVLIVVLMFRDGYQTAEEVGQKNLSLDLNGRPQFGASGGKN